MTNDTPGHVLLLVGPVGAGKSTLAHGLAVRDDAVFLDADTWMVRLFGDDERPTTEVLAWYLARRQRCRDLLWDTAKAIVRTGTSVILELGLVTRGERIAWYQRVHAEDFELRITLLDAPREVRKRRVLARNESAGPFTQVVPEPFFERASDAWEPPDADERSLWNIIDG